MKQFPIEHLREEAERRKWSFLTECMVCQSTNWRPIYKGRDNCVLCKCDDCTVVFLNPRPKKAAQDDSGYKPGHAARRYLPGLVASGILTEDHEPVGDKLYYRYKKLVDMTAALKPTEPVVDLGCGIGLSMMAMQHKGIDAIGFDVNPEFIETATGLFGLDVRYFDVYAPNTGHRYPIATLNAVLEHIDEPVDFLKAIRSNVLTKGGALVITLPNIYSHQFPAKDGDWEVIAGGHVWYPSEATSAMVAERAGFTVDYIHQPPKPARYANIHEMFAREVMGYQGNMTGGLGMVVRVS